MALNFESCFDWMSRISVLPATIINMIISISLYIYLLFEFIKNDEYTPDEEQMELREHFSMIEVFNLIAGVIMLLGLSWFYIALLDKRTTTQNLRCKLFTMLIINYAYFFILLSMDFVNFAKKKDNFLLTVIGYLITNVLVLVQVMVVRSYYWEERKEALRIYAMENGQGDHEETGV